MLLSGYFLIYLFKIFPDLKIDMVFYIEGDKIKREYNKMIHEKNTSWTGGVYNVESRYGLWLCKDFIPIETHNEWISEKSEWTKYHGFVNCQGIKLTANRGDAGNTSSKLLNKIGSTITDLFHNKIKTMKIIKNIKKNLNVINNTAMQKKRKKTLFVEKRLHYKKKQRNFLTFLCLNHDKKAVYLALLPVTNTRCKYI